ncbi:MAG: glycosyltransferase family 4 protein [Oscillochloridaceae bacterium umkhey_bin13]
MRILMLNYEYPPLGGGAAPITQALAEQLAIAGQQVDVLTMGFRGLPAREVHYDGNLRIMRVPAVRRSMVRAETPEMASYLLAALPVVLALSRAFRYDLIHTHFLIPTGPLGVTLKAISGLPLVVTIHGSDVPGYNPDRFTQAHRLLQPVWRQIVHATDAIITPSAYLGHLLQRSVPTPFHVIPYGFSPPPPVTVTRRQRILFASRLFPRKGAHVLLEALAGLDVKDWEVVIAGDGPMLEPLQVQARQLGLPVVFPGFVRGQALHELYASSAIFVFPSLQDNFPVVLLEALSHGCAIITNNCTGMPEVIGPAGLLVPPTDVPALRDALTRLMHDAALRDELAQRGPQRITELRWERIIQAHLALYRQVQPLHNPGNNPSV